MKQPTYQHPTALEAKKHWNAQEPSPQRTPGRPDPGLTVASDIQTVTQIITSTLEGENPPVLRMKHPTDDVVTDYVARSNKMVQLSLRSTAEDFLARCERAEDYELYLIRFGDMKDAQRSQALAKYIEQIHRQQQDSYKVHHNKERAAQTDTRNQIEAFKALNAAKKKIANPPTSSEDKDGI